MIFKETPFNSSDLSQAVSHARPKLESYKATLTHMSEDIKRLESYLLEMGISSPFSMAVSEDFNAMSFDEDFDFGMQITGNVEQHVLSWEELGEKGFRLLYRKTSQENVVRDGKGREMPSPQAGELVELEKSKPLIECKSGVRTQMYPFLPKFVEALANKIPAPTDVQEEWEFFSEELSDSEKNRAKPVSGVEAEEVDRGND